jgi:hypothetical protein
MNKISSTSKKILAPDWCIIRRKTSGNLEVFLFYLWFLILIKRKQGNAPEGIGRPLFEPAPEGHWRSLGNAPRIKDHML